LSTFAGKIDDALKTAKKLKTNNDVWKNIMLAEANADRFDEAVQHLSRFKYKNIGEEVLVKMIEIRIDFGLIRDS
jgi:hypothetical protein